MKSERCGWQRTFDDPMPTPGGRHLITLHHAATYVTLLPKKEADTPEWQAAIEALILVADLGGPTMFARIGMMRALNSFIGAAAPMRGRRKKAARKYRIAR